jgi:hypothetical protein
MQLFINLYYYKHMRWLLLSEEEMLREHMVRKGLGTRSIDNYMSSIRRVAAFFELSPLEMVRFVHSTNRGYNDRESLGDYLYHVYSKAHPMGTKKAYDFRSHMRMAAEVALQGQVALPSGLVAIP